MKKLFIIAAAMAFGAGVADAAPLKKNEAEVTFKTTIQSKHCKDRVEKVVPFEKGVNDMDIKIPEGTVYIKYRSDKTTPEALKKIIEDMGYSVEAVQGAAK